MSEIVLAALIWGVVLFVVFMVGMGAGVVLYAAAQEHVRQEMERERRQGPPGTRGRGEA